MTTTIDHFMYAVADLDAGMRWAAEVFDAAPVYGGAHVGLGTHNALLSLGDTYLEIIAADPDQTSTPGSLGARFASLSEGGLVTWAACGDLRSIARGLEALGIACAGPTRTERRTAQGELLVWELLFPRGHGFGGRCPFFIDWMDCAHPSTTTPVGGRFAGMRITLPEADTLRAALSAVDVGALGGDLEISAGDPAMTVRIECAAGIVELASTPETLDLSFGA